MTAQYFSWQWPHLPMKSVQESASSAGTQLASNAVLRSAFEQQLPIVKPYMARHGPLAHRAALRGTVQMPQHMHTANYVLSHHPCARYSGQAETLLHSSACMGLAVVLSLPRLDAWCTQFKHPNCCTQTAVHAAACCLTHRCCHPLRPPRHTSQRQKHAACIYITLTGSAISPVS